MGATSPTFGGTVERWHRGNEVELLPFGVTEALAGLVAECEQGFSSVLGIFLTRSVAFRVGEYPVPASRDTELPDGAKVYTFHTIFNDEPSRPEGEAGRMASTPEEAVQRFREGWRKFREQSPGSILLWRVKPMMVVREDLARDEDLYAVRARAVIVDAPTD